MNYNQSVFGGFVDTTNINNEDKETVYYPHLQKKRKRRRLLPFFLRKKFISTFLLVCMLVLYCASMFTMPSTAFAEDGNTDYSEDMVRAMYAPFSMITEEYAIYEGEMNGNPISFYYIDAITNVEIEEHDEWIDLIPSWAESPFKSIEGALQRYINGINNLLFEMNMYLATGVISVIGFAFDFDIIEEMLQIVEPSIMAIVGISGGSFTGGLGSDGGGLFGAFIEIIFMMMVIVVFYNLIVNRKLISGLNVILRVILCLTLALAFFSNYSTALSSMHDIAKNITSVIVNDVGGGITTGVASVGSSSDSFVASLYAEDDVTAKGNEGKPMKRLLWNILVERPYAYVQFGSGDIEGTITETRYKDMLSYIPNTEERKAYLIDTEIKDNFNTMVHADRVFNKMGFLFTVLFVNLLTAIPILLVALSIILLQFWYIIVAIIAPFALLLGAIPTMHRVLMRYGLELLIPLFLRVFLTTLLLLLLALTSLSFEFAQSIGSDGTETPFFISYIATAIFIIMLFVMTFLLRNRLSDIFTKGSTFLGELRSATGDLGGMMAGGVRGVSTSGGALTGAVLGGMATGGAGAFSGAIKGANMGKALGNTATGNGDIAGTAMRLYQLSRMEQLGKDKEDSYLDQAIYGGKATGEDYIPTPTNKDNQEAQQRQQQQEDGRNESDKDNPLEKEKVVNNQPTAPTSQFTSAELYEEHEMPNEFNKPMEDVHLMDDELDNPINDDLNNSENDTIGQDEIQLSSDSLDDFDTQQVDNSQSNLQDQNTIDGTTHDLHERDVQNSQDTTSTNDNNEKTQPLADLALDDEMNAQPFVENEHDTEIQMPLHDLNMNETLSDTQPLDGNMQVDTHDSNLNGYESMNVDTNSIQTNDMDMSDIENSPTDTQSINTNTNIQSGVVSGGNLNDGDMQGANTNSSNLNSNATNDDNNLQSQSQMRSSENVNVVQNNTENRTPINSSQLNTSQLNQSELQSNRSTNQSNTMNQQTKQNTQPNTNTQNSSQNQTTNENSQTSNNNLSHQTYEHHRVVDNASNIQPGNLNTHDISDTDGSNLTND